MTWLRDRLLSPRDIVSPGWWLLSWAGIVLGVVAGAAGLAAIGTAVARAWGPAPLVLAATHTAVFLAGWSTIGHRRRRHLAENNHWLGEEIEPVKHAAHLADVADHRGRISGETTAIGDDLDPEPWVSHAARDVHVDPGWGPAPSMRARPR